MARVTSPWDSFGERGLGDPPALDSGQGPTWKPVMPAHSIPAEAETVDVRSISAPADPADTGPTGGPTPDVQASDASARSDQIAQIREILLGGQMQAIEKRFAALEVAIEQRAERMASDLEARFQRSVDDLERKVEDLSQAVSAHSDAQSRAMRAADERLREVNELLRSTSEGLSQAREERRHALAELRGEVREQQGQIDQVVSDLDEHITEGGRRLMREIIDLRTRLDQETSDIRRVTERGFATFASGTIARNDLAEHFAAFARRLAKEGESSS
jgi:gas vesicle protein